MSVIQAFNHVFVYNCPVQETAIHNSELVYMCVITRSLQIHLENVIFSV